MIDNALLESLLEFDDEVGVLSFYVGITPDQAAAPQPPSRLEIQSRIKAVRASTKQELGRDEWRAVHHRLEALEAELDRFMDPREHGRGRALFAGVVAGRTEQ
ncbi:MAG TPA: hypothetical protein VGA69_09695, partial [Nitriliruptorales bacterium]